MTPDKLIIDKESSINEVTNYFENLDSSKRVRARDLGDGRIELYVRKDSFKQFFTDKLRPDSLVKRDYQKARDYIFSMLNQIDPSVENLPSLKCITKPLTKHNHDFCVGIFNQGMHHFLHSSSQIENTKAIIKNNWRDADVYELLKTALPSEEGQKEISEIIKAVKDPEDRKILERNFNALNAVMFSKKSQKNSPTVIDCHHAIDFFRAWLKELPKLTGENNSGNNIKPEGSKRNENSALVSVLTDFSKRLATWGARGNIDYQGGKVGDSHADLIVIDPGSNPPTSHQSFSSDTRNIAEEGEKSASTTFTFLDHNKLAIRNENFDALEIVYQGQSTFDEEKIDQLYKSIEVAIAKKMDAKKNIAANSESTMQFLTVDQLYVMHLPILNPFKDKIPSEREKIMMVEAFIKITRVWTKKYPNLRIKVELPQTISEKDIQSIAWQIDKIKAKTEYQNKNNRQ